MIYITHAQRCNKAFKLPSVFIAEPSKVYTSKQVLKDGVASSQMVVVTDDPSIRNSVYKVQDFSIENLVAAGCFEKLTDCPTLGTVSKLEVSEVFNQ